MLTGGNRILGTICSVTLVIIALSGCASKQRFTTVEKAVVQQKETSRGTIETQVVTILERADKNVIENSASVKSVTRITNNAAKVKESRSGKAAQFERFDISPDGEKLLIPLYDRDNRGREFYQIWTLGTTGIGLTRLTTGTSYDLDPVYSPDGKFVYFSSNRGENNGKIWRVFATGTGGLTRVTTGTTADWAPSISPNGQVLTYTALMGGSPDPQIWTVNINGSLPTQMVVGEHPVFSPDGKKILFQAINRDSKKSDIWSMNADGSARTQLTAGDANYRHARWSQDGGKIVFATDKGLDDDKESNYDIWLMNADGSNMTQLTTNGSADDLPVFDPNGKYIYFRSNRGGSLEIWRMELAM